MESTGTSRVSLQMLSAPSRPASDPSKAPSAPPHKDMVWVPGGTFLMGSELADYPEEGPTHYAAVDGFWMDETPVTIAQFRRFVKATGYITVAERPLDPADYPKIDPALLVAGSLVFQATAGPVDLANLLNWWHYRPAPKAPAPTPAGASAIQWCTSAGRT
jgi:sulfatase modifying factor 1